MRTREATVADLATFVARLPERPRPFVGDSAGFWGDPYIRSHILDDHFDDNNDEASRTFDTRVAEVQAILNALGGDNLSSRRLIDIGCGPGLYSELFAAAGLQTKGIDISAEAVEHAKRRAANLPLSYEAADVRTHPFAEDYDCAVLVYGTYGTLHPRERKRFLQRVQRSLSARKGLLVFDVFTKAYVTRREWQSSEWFARRRNGFWHPSLHLVLSQLLWYPEHRMRLQRVVVAPANQRPKLYHLYQTWYDEATIRRDLSDAGFHIERLTEGIAGPDYTGKGRWIGVYARPA